MNIFSGFEFTISLRDIWKRRWSRDFEIIVHIGLYLRFLPVIWFSKKTGES